MFRQKTTCLGLDKHHILAYFGLLLQTRLGNVEMWFCQLKQKADGSKTVVWFSAAILPCSHTSTIFFSLPVEKAIYNTCNLN